MMELEAEGEVGGVGRKDWHRRSQAGGGVEGMKGQEGRRRRNQREGAEGECGGEARNIPPHLSRDRRGCTGARGRRWRVRRWMRREQGQVAKSMVHSKWCKKGAGETDARVKNR